MSSINSKVNILPKMELTKLSKSILLEKCQELGIKKYKSKSKSQLIDLIKSKTQNEDKCEAKNETKPLPVENKTLPSENYDLLVIIKDLFTTYSLKELANELNVATGTITRWIELNSIPKHYAFDILKLSNIQIDYSRYSSKEKDQFFTPVDTAVNCFKIFTDVIKSFGELKPTGKIGID